LSTSTDRMYSLKSATADGRWKPVPFHGGGIDSDSAIPAARDFEFQFTNPPQTGIVYTAPIFSDHVATSCVLDMSHLPVEGINERSSDELGTRWSTRMAEAIVAPSAVHKSHSLKDMFLKAAVAKQKVVEQSIAEVIDLDDEVSPKRCKLVNN